MCLSMFDFLFFFLLSFFLSISPKPKQSELTENNILYIKDGRAEKENMGTGA